jgi:putative DNA primase/helicase
MNNNIDKNFDITDLDPDFFSIKKPKSINVLDFVSMDIPDREMLLAPILCERGLIMIYAPRGIGKSWLCLSMAWSIATGNTIINRWAAKRSSRVLYVDGEMSADALQKRLKIISGDINGSNITKEMANNFHLYTPDLQDGPVLNLATTDGQYMMKYIIEDRDVIFIDNISTICPLLNENDVGSWLPVNEWLLEMRKKGKSVVLIHHSGKNGSQRGTSGKEIILDAVISLQHKKNYNIENGAQFNVKFEKAREIKGIDASPFALSMEINDNKLTWSCSNLNKTDIDKNEEETERIITLHSAGKSYREISQETGIPKSTVERRIKHANTNDSASLN